MSVAVLSIRFKRFSNVGALLHRHLGGRNLPYLSSIKFRIISWLHTNFVVFHCKYATATVSKLPDRCCVAENRVLCNICCKKSATDVAVTVICFKCGRAFTLCTGHTGRSIVWSTRLSAFDATLYLYVSLLYDIGSIYCHDLFIQSIIRYLTLLLY